MTVTIDGSTGTVTGLAVGGLPSGSVTGSSLAPGAVAAKLGYTPCGATTNPPTYLQCASTSGVVSTNSCVPGYPGPLANWRFQAFLTAGDAPSPTGSDGHIFAWTWVGASYCSQIYIDTDPTNYWAVRTRSSDGTWSSWRNI